MRRVIVAGAVAVIVMASLVVARADPAVTAGRRVAGSTSDQAERALANALSVFGSRPAAEGARSEATVGSRSATMALRDLLLVRDQLSPEQRKVADGLLARPTEGNQDPFGDGYPQFALDTLRNTCTGVVVSTDFCIHWVEESGDAPPLLPDDNANTIPDWVDANVAVFEQVWAHEIDDLGFRAPKPDGQSDDHGPNNRLDVYLANLGNQGLYGYCTSDDPHGMPGSGYPHWDLSAFCVIDEDFVEFPLSEIKSLRATAAHEFFHASQFAYDVAEDLWLMEGSAVWMEDEVFDGVNDHLQYNATSQLRSPWVPVDTGAAGYRYGAWIFWRFLSERFDPGIIRRVWFLADGAQGGLDLDSLRAAARAIKERGPAFRRAFAEFGAWNVRPSARYEEGGLYGVPRVDRNHNVTAANGGTPWQERRLDHLSHRLVVFRSGSGVSNGAKLRVRLDGPVLAAGTEGTAVVRFEDGRIRFFALHANGAGEAQRVVPFGSNDVVSVTLVLTNASTRTDCWRNSVYSCRGRPRDDNERFSYASVLL